MAWSEWEPIPGFDFKHTIFEKKYRDRGGAVARISFNRPERMNALSRDCMSELYIAVTAANLDKDVGVIVLSSVGDHFGVGGDVEEQEAEDRRLPRRASPNDAIKRTLKPVIAAVKGYCIGASHHIAYTCDFTIAADTAIMGQNGPRVASPAHGQVVAKLAHIVGMKRAREIWMLCRRYTAQEALQMGLVNTVVPLAKLDEEVDKWCTELLDLVPSCLAIVKQSFEAVDSYLASTSGSITAMIVPDYEDLPEVKEAQRAFFEKRPPDFWKHAKKPVS